MVFEGSLALLAFPLFVCRSVLWAVRFLPISGCCLSAGFASSSSPFVTDPGLGTPGRVLGCIAAALSGGEGPPFSIVFREER